MKSFIGGFCLSVAMLCPAFSDQISMSEVTVEGDFEGFTQTMTSVEKEPGLQIVTVTLKAETPTVPPQFSVKWHHPSIDVHAHWNTNIKKSRANYYNASVTSRIASGAPVQTYFNNKDINRFTFAASDALNQMKLRTYLREEDALFYNTVQCFTEKSKALTDYSIDILIDRREVRYEESLKTVSEWWETSYKPAIVPDVAKQPMYSTWYNFHQNLESDLLLEELTIAKSIGFDAVIIDDGWQTNDSARGYKYTGDWKPERLTNMPELVEQIHAKDMKVLLWYSLPFVGVGAEKFPKFEGKYLRNFGGEDHAWVLDPRYPECREFIISTYEKALTDWNLDGFKLDFIGWFAAQKNTTLTTEDGRDFASVNLAVQHLMTEVMTRLTQMKPDILIEFRQPYTGPVMRSFGNMLRGVDCPNDAFANRTQIADLRLISGQTAIHSDMLMWHKDEPVEHAARQILATLYSVPQISVLLTKYPEKHLKLVTHWTDYWKKNRDILLNGTFKGHSPASQFPVLEASKGGKTIITAYDNVPIRIGKGTRSLDLINATGGDSLIVILEEGAELKGSYTLFDTMGQTVETEQKSLKPGIQIVAIPPSGILKATGE